MRQARTPFTLFAQTDAADAATADRHAAIHLAGHDRLTERDSVVGIVIVGIQAVRAEIHDFASRRADTGDQFLLHSKPTMIGGNSYAHKIPLVIFPRRLGRRSPR